MCKKLLSGLLGGAGNLATPATSPDQARESAPVVNIDNATPDTPDSNAGRVRLGKSNRNQQQVAGLSI